MPKAVTVTGGAETARAFDQLADDIAKMSDVHERIARGRIPGIAGRTPVRTGELRGSWEAEGSPQGGSILSPLAYAVPINFGTRVLAPVAMIEKTFEAEAKSIEKEYEEAIKEAAKRRGFRVDG